MDDKHPLEESIILLNILRELLEATTNSDHELISFEFQSGSVGPNQVKSIFDPNDRNGDSHLMNVLVEHLVDLISLSWLEHDRSLSEELIALSIKLIL